MQCLARPVSLCDIWKTIKARHPIDMYTRLYYDKFCLQSCLDTKEHAKCHKNKVNCYWHGPPDDGHCRGKTSTFFNDLVAHNAILNKEAYYSYAINIFDCYELCRKSALGVNKERCESLRECCMVGNSDGSCSVDTRKIARKFNPFMIPLANMDMTCKNKSSKQDCDAVRSPQRLQTPILT